MADSNVAVTEGSGKNIDTRTNAGGDHRQVVVLGHESATDSVAGVQATDPSSNALGLIVRDPLGTLTYALMDSTGIRVRSISDGTVSVGTIENVTRVKNVVDGTLTTVTGVDRVRNIVDGTISTVTSLGTATRVDRVFNLIDGTISTVTRVDRVHNVVDGTISTVGTVNALTNVTRVDRVHNVVDGTISLVSALTNITNSIAVHVLSTGGTIAVFAQPYGTAAVSAKDGTFAVCFSPAKPSVLADINATGRIFTVSGTTSTVGNNTLVAPSASYSFKVFAYSIQTTGLVSMAPRFTTGASAGATELWRPLVTAVSTASSPVGANLATTPPGYLFATGTSTTLALYLDTGSLVHYSVSYIKESA